MKEIDLLDNLLERYPALEPCRSDILGVFSMLSESFASGRKLLLAGNGGSAADAEHIVGEMMKSFVFPKALPEGYADELVRIDPGMGAELASMLQGALPAIALDGHTALSTAYMNDCEPRFVFAQQVNGYGRPGDVFLGISTSGNSRNVLYAAVAAKARGMKVAALTGAASAEIDRFADVCIHVPETETYKVQELHLPVYHCLCLMLEVHFFGK